MGCTVAHYWAEHVEGLERKHSVFVDSEVDLTGGDPKRGTIHATIYFHDELVTLSVIEHVEITDRPHRLKYSYHFSTDGQFIIRADFDPSLPIDMQHHTNHPDGAHRPMERISLARMVDQCWTLVDERASLESDDAGQSS